MGGDASMDGAHAGGFNVVTWSIREYPRTFLPQALVSEIIQRRSWDLIAIQEISDANAFAELVDSLPAYEGVLSEERGF